MPDFPTGEAGEGRVIADVAMGLGLYLLGFLMGVLLAHVVRR